MKVAFPYRSHLRRGDSGYVMLVILLMLALLTLTVVRAAPSIATQIKRDREEEMIHRGQQYVRAIKHFYKKFGRYPNSMDDLVETNHIRFLRRKYKDPVTTSGEWRLIHVGEAKSEQLGFLGKSLSAQGTANQPFIGANGQPVNNSQANNGLGGSIFATSGQTSANNNFGNTNSNQNTKAAGGQNTSQEVDRFGFTKDTISGKTLGGGPIIGVASTSEAKSLKEINKKNHYNDWEFVYDPRFDQPQGQLPVQPVNANPNGNNSGNFNLNPATGMPNANPNPQPQGFPNSNPQ